MNRENEKNGFQSTKRDDNEECFRITRYPLHAYTICDMVIVPLDSCPGNDASVITQEVGNLDDAAEPATVDLEVPAEERFRF